MKLKEHFLSVGFRETSVSHQFDGDAYRLVYIGVDSYGAELYSIINKRYDENVFRGRIPNGKVFDRLFVLVQEDYNIDKETITEIEEMADLLD